jgi:hypothetical protein
VCCPYNKIPGFNSSVLSLIQNGTPPPARLAGKTAGKRQGPAKKTGEPNTGAGPGKTGVVTDPGL